MRFIAYTVMVAALSMITYLAINMRSGTMDDIQPAAGATTATYKGTVAYLDRMALSPEAVLKVEILNTQTNDVLAFSERQLEGAQIPVPFIIEVTSTDASPNAQYYLRASLLEDGRPTRVTPPVDVTPQTPGEYDLGELISTRTPDSTPNQAITQDPANARGQMSSDTTTESGNLIGDSKNGVVGLRWRLTDLNGEAPVPESRAFILFGADGRLMGNGGCNSIGSNYTIEGTALEISPAMISTMMACMSDGLSEQERAFTGQLVESRTLSVDEQGLVLSTQDGRTLTFIQETISE